MCIRDRVHSRDGKLRPAGKDAVQLQPGAAAEVQMCIRDRRMTDLVGTRSDVSNNTVAFTETAQDADIASGEKLSVLFGKIKKRFSVVNKLVNGAVYLNLGTNTNFPDAINQRGKTTYTGDNTSPYCIDRWRISNGTTYTVGTFTLSAATYANRACGMWQSNEMGAHQLSIGADLSLIHILNIRWHIQSRRKIPWQNGLMV